MARFLLELCLPAVNPNLSKVQIDEFQPKPKPVGVVCRVVRLQLFQQDQWKKLLRNLDNRRGNEVYDVAHPVRHTS